MAAMDPEEWSMKAFIFFLLFQFCRSMDTITPTQNITDGDILVSTGESFALGFFSPSGSGDRYLGIWYNKISEKTPVWIANRETPLKNSNGVLTINEDGNLVVLDKNQNNTSGIWSTNVSISHNDSIAKLLDSGNLQLIQTRSQRVLWQSFDHPTNTFLPGMKIGLNKKTGEKWSLTSWKSRNDPAQGNYSYALDPRGSPQLFLYKGSAPYWRTGPWIGFGFNGIPEMARLHISNFSFVNDQDMVYTTYSLFNDSIYLRVVLDDTGSLQPLTWLQGIREWNALGLAPRDRCDDYGHCGPYGSCNTNNALECECLPGFDPKSPRDWYLRDWSAGCARKREQDCGNEEGFLKLARVKVPDTSISLVDTSLSLKECENECLSNCSCVAYTNANFNGGGSGCITWYGELMDIREFTEGEQDLYVRVDSIELAANASRKSKGFLGKKKNLAILFMSIVPGFFLLVFCGYCFLRKMNKTEGITENERRPELLFFNLAANVTRFEDSSGTKKFEESRTNPELKFFDLSTVVAATDNFSSANKLGQGGFGPVYKGQLFDGQEIAVKRLSKTSGQGIEEFKNEVMLIAQLQHRNLVRLLGCCIQEEEKMLIYEYMPNKSLDSFIFDQTRKALLDWRKRFEIIIGIARGVLYLHQDSRLRIIHRDLKASNVLLDAEMNPKISDFGMARIFGGNQMQANTNRVVGTYGYMSPEYAMNGVFSIKSDVFSFGVLLLEVISCKRNNGCYEKDQFLNLIGHAWGLWSVDKALDIVDSSMAGSYPAHEVLRCIHVGLLCVQESAADRPPMSTVVFMLGNETTLPPPKQPAFLIGGMGNGPHSSSNGAGQCSLNEATITMLEAR